MLLRIVLLYIVTVYLLSAHDVQNGSDTLGIGIAGGRYTCGYDTPIYVTNVQPDGCLAKTGQISVYRTIPSPNSV